MTNNLSENLIEIEKYLDKYKNKTLSHFIGGKEVMSLSGNTFENYSPVNNEKIGSIASGAEEDIELACDIAKNVSDEWRKTSGKIKQKLLHKIADGSEKRAREIALV